MQGLGWRVGQDEVVVRVREEQGERTDGVRSTDAVRSREKARLAQAVAAARTARIDAHVRRFADLAASERDGETGAAIIAALRAESLSPGRIASLLHLPLGAVRRQGRRLAAKEPSNPSQGNRSRGARAGG